MNTPLQKADAIVVGSGFGGAVAAARLSDAGLRVLLLERGPWWQTNGTAIPGARHLPRGPIGVRKMLRGVRWARGRRGRCIVVNRDGLIELHVFDTIQAVTASGMGGGSLIYGDVQTKPDAAYFRYFPAAITAPEMDRYYDRVRDVMRPSPFPATAGRSRVLERFGGEHHHPLTRAELAVSWAPPATAPAMRSTSYLFGSDAGGKRSLDKTYVPMAQGAGATVRALCEVTGFERDGARYRVFWKDHGRGGRGAAQSPLLVLAAGTFGTLRLLFGARDASLPLPASLGRHFAHGADLAASLFRCPDAEDSPYGPNPSLGLAYQRNGEHSFLILESGLPFDSLPLPHRLLQRMRNVVGLSAMGRDSASADLWFDGRELHTAASRAPDRELFETIEAEIERIAAAYHPGSMTFEHGPGARLTTVHPLGGACMADDAEEGVVDHSGQVFGNPGLYVADGSALPRAPGWPPSMTIAALAERQAELIVRTHGR